MTRSQPIPAALFSIVLGLSGLGQGWRVAAHLWPVPALLGEAVLLCTVLVWAGLLLGYVAQAVAEPARTVRELRDPVAGGTAALVGVSTFLVAQAVVPYSHPLAWALVLLGMAWHLPFSLWHTAGMWQGGRAPADTTTTVYLPTVAANLTGAGALGALGQPDWAWLFFGAAVLSWLALEPLVVRRLWHTPTPPGLRPLIGIQFSPAVVTAAALLLIAPDAPTPVLLMLLGYSLFQMAVELRLWAWLGESAFAWSYWAFSFGVVSAAVTCLKLAGRGVPAAVHLAFPVFVGANLFVGWLCVRSLGLVVRRGR
ncbi:MAG: dicarboxylate transporter/tellurite-resistance protein TehA [Pseudomonadota bacterium]